MDVCFGNPHSNLFLLTLLFRLDYGARLGDVRAVSGGYNRHRCACRFDGFTARLLFKSQRRTHALWHNARANLLRNRLCQTKNLVDNRVARFDSEYFDLVNRRIDLVENFRLVVSILVQLSGWITKIKRQT